MPGLPHSKAGQGYPHPRSGCFHRGSSELRGCQGGSESCARSPRRRDRAEAEPRSAHTCSGSCGNAGSRLTVSETQSSDVTVTGTVEVTVLAGSSPFRMVRPGGGVAAVPATAILASRGDTVSPVPCQAGPAFLSPCAPYSPWALLFDAPPPSLSLFSLLIPALSPPPPFHPVPRWPLLPEAGLLTPGDGRRCCLPLPLGARRSPSSHVRPSS